MDVVVSPGWLDPLVGFLEATPDAGVACPLILLESDPDRINAAGQNLNKTGLGFNRWLGKPRGVAGEAPFEVDGLHGAAFVIRRALLERLGGWDESGFLYFEDVELSWLLRIAGDGDLVRARLDRLHDYHLSMFPHKLFLLERNRWKMLLADLGRPNPARALAAAGAHRADDVGLLPAARAQVPAGEAAELRLGEGEPRADRPTARAGRLGSPALRPRGPARPATGAIRSISS